MKGRIGKIGLIAGLVIVGLLIPAVRGWAVPPAMESYCVKPPFLGTSTTPNVGIILDSSGSMNCLAYQSGYDPTQFVNGKYYGYFEPDLYYQYITGTTVASGTNPDRWKPVSGFTTVTPVSSVTPIVAVTAAHPVISGNMLNWITMSRQDVAKKILVGGRATSGTYNECDRSTLASTSCPSPTTAVKLYGNSDAVSSWTCATNYKSFDSTTSTISTFIGDYKYTTNTGHAETFSVLFNDPATIKLYPNSNFTGTNPVYNFPTDWERTPVATTLANAYTLVDEAAANTTDYITNKTSTTPALFKYNHGDAALAAASGTISSITVYAYAKRTGTTSYSLQAELRVKDTGADFSQLSGLSALGTAYSTVNFSFATNPQTGLAWQWSDLTGSGVGNLMAFGVKAVGPGSIAPTSTNYVTVSQVYIQVNVSSPPSGGPYNIIIDQGTTPASGILDQMQAEVRFGMANYNSSGEGGHISNITTTGTPPTDTYVRFGSVPNMIKQVSELIGSGVTPLAETYYEMVRYFRQDSTYYASSDYTKGCVGATNGTSACGAGAAPSIRDPYYFDFTDPQTPDGYVPCAKSFVILMTDGEPYDDLNLPGTTSGSPARSTVPCDLTHIKGCSGYGTLPSPRYGGTSVGQAYVNNGSDYLIDVAYWARTKDMRPGQCSTTTTTECSYDSDCPTPQTCTPSDVPAVWRKSLPGKQNVVFYPVFLFGRNSTLLADAAIYGGFEDTDNTGIPDCVNKPEKCYRDSNNDGHIYAVRHNFCSNEAPSFTTTCITNADCGAGTCLEPDSPITYFEGDDGYKLETSIVSAINAILARTASGTAASVLASGEGSGANLVQSIFYPKRSFVGSTEISWIGTLSNMWYNIDPRLNNSTIREDTVGDRALKLTQDRIVEYTFDASTNQTGMNLFIDANGDGIKDNVTPDATANMDTLKYLWEAGRILFQQTAGDNSPGFASGSLYSSTARNIWTNTNDDSTLDTFSTANAATLRPLLGLATDGDASNLIRYIRGNDGVTVDLNGDGVQDATRSRAATVTISGSDVNGIWKLGDVINSTPKISSWTPLNQYDKTYGDHTYTEFTSSSTYKNRGMVFVGGNDGMLHAFKLGLLGIYNEADRKATLGKYCSSTTTKGCSSDSDCPTSETCLTDADIGKEAWAFIPKNSLPYLLYQAKDDYCHLYYVDASPVIFDASIEAPGVHTSDYWTQPKTVSSWRTVLIGGMRYGGACRSNGASCTECNTTPISGNSVGLSSFFALDITDPESPTLLWEYAHSALGLSSTGPAIVRINTKHCSVTTATSCNTDSDCPSTEQCLQDKTTDGRWFVVVGSGPSGYVSSTSNQLIAVSEHNYLAGDTKGNIKLHVLDLKTGSLVRAIDAGEDAAFAGSLANATIDVDNNYSDDALYFGFTARNTLGANGTAQAGSTATTIKLAAADPTGAGGYNGKFIHRTDGLHETKLIINYDNVTKIAVVDSAWKNGIPAAGTTYNILDGWTTGGVKRLFTEESINPTDWDVSDVIRTTGPVTASVAKLVNVKTHELKLFFGTGRFFYRISQIVDNANGLQRLYGVKDPCIVASGTKTVVNTACSTTVLESSLGAAYSAADTNTTGSTDTFGNVNIDGTNDPDGWYIPLQAQFGTSGAERDISDPLATTIGVVFFTTTKPSSDICSFGGKSYIWAVRYDTGGTVPTGTLHGKAMIQLSTGAIQQIDLGSAFNAQGNRRTSMLMTGLPPVDQGLNVPIPPKPIAKVLHMQKK